MSRKSDDDNHSNQLNPNNDAYWSSRGIDRSDDEEEYEDRSWSPPPSYYQQPHVPETKREEPFVLEYPVLFEADVDFAGYQKAGTRHVEDECSWDDVVSTVQSVWESDSLLFYVRIQASDDPTKVVILERPLPEETNFPGLRDQVELAKAYRAGAKNWGDYPLGIHPFLMDRLAAFRLKELSKWFR